MMAFITTSYLPINPIRGKISPIRTKRIPLLPVAAELKQKKSTPLSKSILSTLKDESHETAHKKATNTYSSEPSDNKSKPVVPRMTFSSLSMAFCNALEEMIDTLLSPSTDSCDMFYGYFTPVDEAPPTHCPVIYGNIPTCLIGGAYIRNGPNPQYIPNRRHHIFDGDGMLHSLLLSADCYATLCSRYVKTHKYILERDAGCPIIPGVFSGFHGHGGLARVVVILLRALTGQINFSRGIGLVNTSLMLLAGRLYALGESDLPYAIHVDPATGEISTVGRFDFEGQLKYAMTAHPKKDPKTGETFAFRYSIIPPFLSYFRFDAAGNKSDDVPIFSVKQSSLLHDFAITENYVLFLNNQIVVKPMELILGRGNFVGSDNSNVPCLRMLPRYATNESLIKQYEIPGFNMIHAINAWEEKNANGEQCVVLVASNLLGVEHALENMELAQFCVEMIQINLSTGVVSRTPLSAHNLEFGVINSGFVGRRNRYAYLVVFEPNRELARVVKLDFLNAGRGDCVVARRNFGPGCFCGEPFFVPKDDIEDEDDGYLLCYVHNERKGESKFVVMDACSSKLDIVAEVLLPRRIPYGFHGLFVTRPELHSQFHSHSYGKVQQRSQTAPKNSDENQPESDSDSGSDSL